MTKHVLLNNVTHKDLKVKTRFDAAYGDAARAVMTFPTEFADIQREYPILLRKDEKTGEFHAFALLGLASDENLYLEGDRWSGNYVPAIVARGPFLIGFQEREVDGEIRREPVIHVDIEDPRVGEQEGEPVFMEHGGNSPYLEKVAKVLNAIHEGMAYGQAMYSALADLELIEPVNLEVSVTEEQQYKLGGFYTINDEKLSALDGVTLEKLNKAGFLEGAFLMKSSLPNIHRLVERKRALSVVG